MDGSCTVHPVSVGKTYCYCFFFAGTKKFVLNGAIAQSFPYTSVSDYRTMYLKEISRTCID